MAENLGVSPVDLHRSAGHADMAADDLRTQHGAAHERIAAAQGGWIGVSAKALTARLADWEQETVGHYTELAGHSDHLRRAAASYVNTDDSAASGIDGAASHLGGSGL